jgi:hypothetical protein
MKQITVYSSLVLVSFTLAGCASTRYAALEERVNKVLAGSAFTYTHIERYPDGMLHLSVGNFGSTNITDLSALAKIPYAEIGIDYLDIQGWNFAADFSPLSGLRIKGLGVGGSPNLTNTAFLAGMKLQQLDLTQCYELTDLSPLRGMPLSELKLESTKVSDLSPLVGMKLRKLNIESTAITDLSPLAGMPLNALDICFTKVTDLSPLEGMPLGELDISFTPINDLTPLRGMPLRELIMHKTRVTDLTPIAGIEISQLYLAETGVTNLSPLAGMPLEKLHLEDTYIRDFSPLKGAPLRWLCCLYRDDVDFSGLKDLPLQMLYVRPVTSESQLDPLRGMRTLRSINNETPETFWRAHDEGMLGKPSVITFGGGDGRTLQTAVVIRGVASSSEVVDAEHRWIRENHPDWEKGNQALLTEGDRSFDRIDYQLPTGEKQTLYFDITSKDWWR